MKTFNVTQAAAYLNTSSNAVYLLASTEKLHPVHGKGVLLFAKTDLVRYRAIELELSVTKLLQEGRHPLDVYLEADGRFSLKQVDRVMRDWARLTGIWLVEAPRGSYARWLARMGLLAISPRALRRLLEALLTDSKVSAAARAYLADQRYLHGEDRATSRRAKRSSRLAPQQDAEMTDSLND